MKLTRIVPTAPVRTAPFRDDFDRMVDRFFGAGSLPGNFGPLEEMWTPNLDFSETEKEYVVRLEAPGVAKKDLEITLEGDILTIRGDRVVETEEKDEKYFWRERQEGRFLRSLRLPTVVEAGKVEAKVDHGIVTVRLPKKAPTPSNRIPVT
jgi:HSP20 family protein